MRKIIIIILIFFLVLSSKIVLAKVSPYFSFQKSPGGLMIGIEIFNEKTKKSLKVTDYNYIWKIPDVSLISRKTKSNIFFISLENISEFLKIDLGVSKPFSKENYSFTSEFINKPPLVKIAIKRNGILLPLELKLNKSDTLTVLTKNFSSKNLQYIWEFNGVFVSNEKEIPVSLLNENNGILKIKVYGYFPNEQGVAEKLIKIE